MAADGDRVSQVLNNDELWLKSGTSLDNPWVKLLDSAAKTAAAPGRVAAITRDTALRIWDGSSWWFMLYGAVDADVSSQRVAVALNNGELWTKQGGLGAQWVWQLYGATDVAVTDSRVVVRLNNGELWAKEGSLGDAWQLIATNAVSVDAEGQRIAYIDGNQALYVKEGALNAPWVFEVGGATRMALSGDRIATILNNKELWAKDGSLTAPWIFELNGAVDLAVSHYDNPYATSVQYGGTNATVDTEAEIAALVAYLSSASVDAANSAWAGLKPGDQETVMSWEGWGVANADWSIDVHDLEFVEIADDLADAIEGDSTASAAYGGLPPGCRVNTASCVKRACDAMESLFGDLSICSADRPRTPQWWLDRVTKNSSGVEKKRAHVALRSSLGSAPADTAGARTGWAAHHIVAAYHHRAVWTRIIMTKCQIHPNSVNNGIYLRGPARYQGTSGFSKLTESQRDVAEHRAPWVHTKLQFEAINRHLLKAVRGSGCDATVARSHLNQIKSDLQDGKVPTVPAS